MHTYTITIKLNHQILVLVFLYVKKHRDPMTYYKMVHLYNMKITIIMKAFLKTLITFITSC